MRNYNTAKVKKIQQEKGHSFTKAQVYALSQVLSEKLAESG
jgi:hypothetical protein